MGPKLMATLTSIAHHSWPHQASMSSSSMRSHRIENRPCALDGWYIGPTLESYQCYNVWLWDTRHERICDTILWFPTKVTMPLASSTDLVMAGIQDIIQALQNPTANSPLAPRTDSQVQALQDLTSLLTGIIKQDSHEAPSLRVAGCPSNIE
jgi:hypothetical protein